MRRGPQHSTSRQGEGRGRTKSALLYIVLPVLVFAITYVLDRRLTENDQIYIGMVGFALIMLLLLLGLMYVMIEDVARNLFPEKKTEEDSEDL